MEQRAYTVAELLTLGVFYMRAKGVSQTKLSTVAAGHNRLFERLAAGYDCRTQAAMRASDWFDANWPVDLAWPKGISRRTRVAKAA